MKKKRTISRWVLARRLHDLALQIAAGRPARVGGVSVHLPDLVTIEEEVETRDGATELELEITWPGGVKRR